VLHLGLELIILNTANRPKVPLPRFQVYSISQVMYSRSFSRLSAGLTRSKSVLNPIGMSYVGFCAATIVWIVVGYSLVFGGDGAWIGSLDHLFLGGISIDSISGTIPTSLFVAFQGTFAAITVAFSRYICCHYCCHCKRFNNRTDQILYLDCFCLLLLPCLKV